MTEATEARGPEQAHHPSEWAAAAAQALTQARAEVGLSQQDVAHFVGVDRAMVSYWESGKRQPNARQITALAQLYRLDPDQILRGDTSSDADALAKMLYRTAKEDLPGPTRLGIRDFTRFLDFYAGLADQAKVSIHGCKQSPFRPPPAHWAKDDAYRKAEEVRSHLGLGLGPVPDVDHAAEMLGITVFRSDLGDDIRTCASGAFLNHPRVGFAIVVNMAMTPGRQRFTVAHEIAHALFHSQKHGGASVSTSRRNGRERFADAFAAAFLMPPAGLKRFAEIYNIGSQITDPADAIRVQRFFNTSWAMTLIGLSHMNMLSPADYESFRRVHPVHLARSLGYETADAEYGRDEMAERVARFPRPFLRLVQLALKTEVISVPTLASAMGLAISEITQIVPRLDPSAELDQKTAYEMDEYQDVFA